MNQTFDEENKTVQNEKHSDRETFFIKNDNSGAMQEAEDGCNVPTARRKGTCADYWNLHGEPTGRGKYTGHDEGSIGELTRLLRQIAHSGERSEQFAFLPRDRS